MTDNEYILMVGRINSFMRYAKNMYAILDWYAENKRIVLACNQSTFVHLCHYAKTHYPELMLSEMTVSTFIARASKEAR